MKRPFPYDVLGRFSELSENGKTRFFEVHTCEYDIRNINRLKEIDCYEQSRVYEFAELIEDEIPEKAWHLYKLETYYANSKIKDKWDFNESISEYQQFGFHNFDDLMTFCEKEWNLSKSDFKPQSETNIP